MNYEISVIIPTYKRPDLLIQTIINLKAQIFNNFEIVIVDDNGLGTNEQINTQKYLERLNQSNLRYFALTKNHGAPYARNYGASVSQGNYLSFLDDDDKWEKEKLAEQYILLKNNPNHSFIFCNQALAIKGKIMLFRKWFYIGNFSSKIIQGNFVGSSSNPMINKDYFNAIGGFDLNLPSCQDWDLWIRLNELASPIHVKKTLVIIDRVPIERISSNKLNVLLGHIMLFEKVRIRYRKHWFSLLFIKLKITRHLFKAFI